MKNYEKYGFTTLDTENYKAFCNIYNNRVGFVHECRLESKKTGEQTTAKSQYYNRTWESYQFESVILRACEKLSKDEREQAKNEFEHFSIINPLFK